MTARLHIVGVRYGYRQVDVLRGVDLDIAAGCWTVLLGPNGAGKTTLMRCIAGIERPHAGRILIDGLDVHREPVCAKVRLGMAVDMASLPPLLSGRETLTLFAGARGLRGLPHEIVRLADALGALAWLDQPLHACSLGTRQKIAVLCGLIGQPPLLLLDEPFNGLDPASALVLKRHLRARVDAGAAVLLATHALDFAERHADAAVLLEGVVHRRWDADALGQIRAGTAAALETQMAEACAPAIASSGA